MNSILSECAHGMIVGGILAVLIRTASRQNTVPFWFEVSFWIFVLLAAVSAAAIRFQP